MTRSGAKRLNDIRRMCSVAADLVARGHEAFASDPTLWLALERCVEVAGEAATQLDEPTKQCFPEVAWKELIAVRVRLAHAYFRIDQEIMWEIASVDMPKVAEALGPIGSTQTG